MLTVLLLRRVGAKNSGCSQDLQQLTFEPYLLKGLPLNHVQTCREMLKLPLLPLEDISCNMLNKCHLSRTQVCCIEGAGKL